MVSGQILNGLGRVSILLVANSGSDAREQRYLKVDVLIGVDPSMELALLTCQVRVSLFVPN